MRLFALIAFACLAFTSTAFAAPQTLTYCASDGTYRQACGQAETRIQSRRTGRAAYVEGGATIIGGRPAGCPKAYCGCGLARYLGINDARLNLAWNWARLFPKAQAGTGMAVVWRHHVAYIESMVGDREALLRDYNSGKGLSRLHVRSIAGAVIVDPRSRVASND
jgi:hypothetical protein